MWNNPVKITRHTEGDSRVATELPTFTGFNSANSDHRMDVKNLVDRFCEMLKYFSQSHDWTKVDEPYRSMFYRDLCATLEGRMDFMDGQWAHLHYFELERHHLKRHCPDDVNLFDVIEMICDCVAAGMARSGDVYDLDLDPTILTKAIDNTVSLLKDEIEVVEK